MVRGLLALGAGAVLLGCERSPKTGTTAGYAHRPPTQSASLDVQAPVRDQGVPTDSRPATVARTVAGRIDCTGNPTAGTELSCGVGDTGVYFLRDDPQMHLIEVTCLGTVAVQGQTDMPCEIRGEVRDERLVSVTAARLLPLDNAAVPASLLPTTATMTGEWMETGRTCTSASRSGFAEGTNLSIAPRLISGFEWMCDLDPAITPGRNYIGNQVCYGDGMDGSRTQISIELLPGGLLRVTDASGTKTYRRCAEPFSGR